MLPQYSDQCHLVLGGFATGSAGLLLSQLTFGP